MDMQQILLNKPSYMLAEYFNEFCKEDLNYLPLMKIFLKLEFRDKLNSELLSSGLMGAIENNQPKNKNAILKYMAKYNIAPNISVIADNLLIPIETNNHEVINVIFESLKNNNESIKEQDLPTLQMLFNCAQSCNNINFANQLDQQYSIVKQSMNESMGEYIHLVSGAHSTAVTINSDGSLSFSGAMGGELSDLEYKVSHYSKNPILFSLQNFNNDLLDSYFNKNYLISPSLVTHALVISGYHENQEAIDYLLHNKECNTIIRNSPEIKNFIYCDDDDDCCIEMKTHIKKFFFYNHLQNTISEKSNEHKKIKI